MKDDINMLSTSNLKTSWEIRRYFMFWVVLFSMAVIAYVLYSGADSRVAETSVDMAFVIIGTTLSSYVFGAAWEDINKIKAVREGL